MSNLSAFPMIQERSEATPGLWNNPFSIISANIEAINSDLTINFASGNTLSVFSSVDASENLHAGNRIGIGATPSSDSVEVLTIGANSSLSDYILFHDPSGAKSNYIIGSRVGGTADGLNLYDLSGQTMIVGFSKQSTKFYSPVVGTFFDLGGTVFNVKSFGAIGDGVADDTQPIQDAINFANGRVVYLPAGTYLITSQLSRVNRAVSGVSSNIPGLKLQGDGMYNSVIDSRVTNGFAIVCDSTVTEVFQWGGYIRDLSISPGVAASNNGGISLTCCWEFSIINARINSLTSDAIYIPLRNDLSANVDEYASQFMRIANCLITGNHGWGFNGAGNIAWSGTIDGCYFINNRGGGIYIAAPQCAVRNSSLAANGINANGGMWLDSSFGGLAGNKVLSNEFDSNYSYCILAEGVGAEISENRFIATLSGASMQPPQGVILGDASEFLIKGNHVRTTSTNTRPFTAFNLLAASSDNVLLNNHLSAGDNTSGLTRYINNGSRNRIMDSGAWITGLSVATGTVNLTDSTNANPVVITSNNTTLGVFPVIVSQIGGGGAIDFQRGAATLGGVGGRAAWSGTTSNDIAIGARTNSGVFIFTNNSTTPSLSIESTSTVGFGVGKATWAFTGNANAIDLYNSGGNNTYSAINRQLSAADNSYQAQVRFARTATGGNYGSTIAFLAEADAAGKSMLTRLEIRNENVVVSNALGLPAGSAQTGSMFFSSESSLGVYRSGISTIAISRGTFDLATNAVRFSMRTLAASAVTVSAANTNVATNEVVFTVGGASGASLAVHSGGTVYIFNSDISAKAT